MICSLNSQEHKIKQLHEEFSMMYLKNRHEPLKCVKIEEHSGFEGSKMNPTDVTHKRTIALSSTPSGKQRESFFLLQIVLS